MNTSRILNTFKMSKGEAGTGKSTFAVKLVLDWCSDSITYQETSENEIDIQVDHKVDQAVPNTISNGKNLQDPTENIIYDRQRQNDLMFDDTETLMNFQCVFLIRLRDFDDEKEIVNMIKQQIIDKMYADQDREVACTLLHEIMGKEDCLIIQDGLDEWTNRDGKDALPSIVTFHNQCTVLTTTRPWKMTDERIKNIDSTLELDGLNEPYALSSIIIERRFKTESFVRKADFVKYIENNDSLKDLLPSPMLLKLIVNMWMDGIMLSGSLCEIYSILLDNLLKKVTTSKGYFHSPPVFCFERTKHIKPNIACFNAISKLAFSMLFSFERKSSIVFSDRELSEYLLDDQKLFALNAGILSERKGNTLSNLCTSSFVHKSVQEFLAAYHITMNAGVIDEQVRKYIEQFSNTDFKQLYVFLMGMNGVQSAKLCKLIEATIGKDDASLKNDLGRATTGAFRSQSSDAASAKELQFQSLIMAGNKEAEAVKRMATDKHDPSRLVHSANNHIEGRLSVFNIKTHGWRKQYVVVSCRKVLFYSREADRHTSIPMRVLDIENLTHVRSVSQGDAHGADATFIPRIFQVLYSSEGKNRNTEENPEEINSLIKSKSDVIDHKSPEFIELHFRTPTTCDSCNKPMWHIHRPNVTERRHCHFKLHKDDFDEREEELGCYCTVKFDQNKQANELLLLADSADDQQTWVTHLSKKISKKCTSNQGTLGAPIQPDHVNQTSAANQVIIVQKQTRHIFRDHTRISNISGICETASGELVITGRRNWSVELLNSSYAVVDNLQLPQQPKSMCSTDGNTVAIVVGYNQVFFIKTTNAQLVKDRTLELQHNCLGIAHRQGTIYITSGTALYQYTVDGEMAGYIYMHRGLRATSCAVSPDGDRIYLVDVEGHQLITLSRNGTVISILSDSKLVRRYTDFPGLHVTDLGQVLVCGGHRSDTIFQVDKDGKQILAKVVTEKETGKIVSVCYSVRTNKLIVGTLYYTSLIEYTI
ncbi:uncharacterized protein LOC127861869 isoform X2 [Dreissena polymorpha]|uniref:uncharacterized protein LOC127861869 isoform X2 n=1 Tax=Dreissena polymorpha TaxID=45954 RepID=UPI00226532E2|nr:uncharacterized protein LOC127861869 isoform X2 [Dreissena polymorpha]